MTDNNEAELVLEVPRSEAEKRDLLATLPIAWEYLLFASELRSGIERHEERWRDFSLSYAPPSGSRVGLRELPALIGDEMARSSFIVQSMMGLFDQDSHRRAFGPSGEPGDRRLIEHLALRLTDCYGQLIDWGLGMLSLVVPEEARGLTRATSKMVEEPLLQFRAWSAGLARDLETTLRAMQRSPSEDVRLTADLVLTISPAVSAEVDRQVKALGRAINGSR